MSEEDMELLDALMARNLARVVADIAWENCQPDAEQLRSEARSAELRLTAAIVYAGTTVEEFNQAAQRADDDLRRKGLL